MKTLSNLIGKPIISIYNGNIEGYIKNLLFDKKLCKLCFLQFFNDDTQEEKILNIKSVYKIGQDAVVIKNDTNIMLDTIDTTNLTNPTNFDVYTIDGKCLGKVNDVVFNDSYKIENLTLSNKTNLQIKDILNVGKNIIILKTEQKKLKITDFKAKNKIITTKNKNISVQIQNGVTVLQAQKPNKLLANNYSFLIGRKTSKNIYADNGLLLVKKQSKITNTVIGLVCKNGKLKELTANSFE